MTGDEFHAALIEAFGNRQVAEYAELLKTSHKYISHMMYGIKPVTQLFRNRVLTAVTRKRNMDRSARGEKELLGDEATRPMLIGVNDYTAPSAFKPFWPTGASLGHHMWFMLYEQLLMSKAEYIRSFDRHTLIFIPKHHSATKKEKLWQAFAYAKGQELRPHLANRTAILLDEKLMRMLSLPHTENYLAWHTEPDGFRWCRAPRRPPLGVWKELDANSRVAERLVEIYMDWLSVPQ